MSERDNPEERAREAAEKEYPASTHKKVQAIVNKREGFRAGAQWAMEFGGGDMSAIEEKARKWDELEAAVGKFYESTKPFPPFVSDPPPFHRIDTELSYLRIRSPW